MTIKNVAIVGGTHGNEWTGIYLLNRWDKKRGEITRPSFSTNTFLGNPKAFEITKRFVDQDLNRSFSFADLKSPVKNNYESQRAAFLNDQIGPKGNPKHDFIIDLHTSTSNCGAMLIVSNLDSFNLQLASYISTKVDNAHIWYPPPAENEDPPYLSAMSDRNLGVEIGPIAQGLLQMSTFRFMNEIVSHALDFVHAINEGHFPELPTSIDVFIAKGPEPFPKKNGQIIGMIHPSLQGRDYLPLQPGAPMFETINDEVVPYSGSEPSYPVFINEAAYYYKGLAFIHCIKEGLEVPKFNSSDR